MSIQEKHAALKAEAQALKYFYNTSSDVLKAALAAFEAAFTSPEHVEAEEFTALLNAIDAEIEDICCLSGICQEVLEELMKQDPHFKYIVI